MNQKPKTPTPLEVTTIYASDYQKQSYPQLEGGLHCEIAIIGGGLSGLSAAYQLSSTCKNIVLLEADTIARSNSGRNTGKLSIQQDLIYAKMIKNHGIEVAQTYVDTQQEALKQIQHIIETHHIDCDFKYENSVVYTTIPEEVPEYAEEYEACQKLGLSVSIMDRVDVDPNCLRAIVMRHQASYNPKKYCDGLARVCTEQQVSIFEHTPVVAYHKENDVIVLETAQGIKVIADRVLVATSFPCLDDGNLYFLRLPNLRSYIVTGKSEASTYDYNNMKEYYITTNKPTKSMRSVSGEFMFCGGDHPVGLEVPDPFRDIKEIAHRDYQVNEFSHQWAAQDYLTHDDLPYCGFLSPNTERMFVMTGYNQWGNLNSMTCALVIKQLMKGLHHPLAPYVNAQRVTSILSVEFFQDNAEMIRQMILSKFQQKEEMPMKADTHALVKINGKTYGAYMNENNQLYLVDVLCPHAGCTVRFNDHEKTWDCPCHSSRYHYDGSVLSGPSTQPLKLFNEGFNTIDPHWFD